TMVDIDLDAYNISTMPHFLPAYIGYNSFVPLSNHALNIRDLERFKDWVYIVTGSVEVRVHPRFKDPLFEYFKATHTIYKNSYTRAFITRSQRVGALHVIDALEAVGCEHVRLSTYGAKLEGGLLDRNFGNEVPRLAVYNTFDIGKTYHADHIIVGKPVKPSNFKECYPMFMELGEGRGSIEFEAETGEGDVDIRVKGYPRFVHSLKNLGSHHLSNNPEKARTWHARVDSVAKKLRSLQQDNPEDLGGWRLEATVCARSLHEAIKIVLQSGSLDFNTYIGQHDFMISFGRITKDEYVKYCDKFIEVVRSMKVSKSYGKDPTTKTQKQAITDLYNAFGWNTGKRRPTKWNDPKAWW
ncbi:hypothetical protein DFH28DRAFT_858778, partial [Melampsora americana]